jgi:hypothetical protein
MPTPSSNAERRGQKDCSRLNGCYGLFKEIGDENRFQNQQSETLICEDNPAAGRRYGHLHFNNKRK